MLCTYFLSPGSILFSLSVLCPSTTTSAITFLMIIKALRTKPDAAAGKGASALVMWQLSLSRCSSKRKKCISFFCFCRKAKLQTQEIHVHFNISGSRDSAEICLRPSETACCVFPKLQVLKSILQIWAELVQDQTKFSLMKRRVVVAARRERWCAPEEEEERSRNNGKGILLGTVGSQLALHLGLRGWGSPSDHSPIKSYTHTGTCTRLHVEWPASIMNMHALEEC